MIAKRFSILLTVVLSLTLAGCGKTDTTSNSAGNAAEAGNPKYHCPMHPTYVSAKPGDCPICNMKLVPIGGSSTETTGAGIPGRVPIVLTAEKRQLIGLATSPVEKRHLTRTARNAGTVTHEETRFARIAPRFGGWVRSLQVNYTGQLVESGQPLLTVYSPELFTAENDYLAAVRSFRAQTNNQALPNESIRHVMDSARRRLELFQVSGTEIRALEESGKPGDELQIRAPLSGHVLIKNVVEGQAFAAGETLYEIADLRQLWVRASIHESDLPQVHIGQKARLIFPNLGSRTIETKVDFIYPHIDPQTRRAEARLSLDNPRHEFRPNMWVDVEIEVDLGEVLAVPASAIIDTGTRNVAFVDADKDHIEPRELKIGSKTEDYVEVLEGLKAGERVVTRALFLVDSESQLKAAISGMSSEHEH
jgi:membrane fusion protein, copper/silver efflux system